MFLKAMRVPLVLTVAVLVAVAIIGNFATAVIVGTLAVLEISLSFDNAVVNAVILRKLSPFWQQMFLTLGILIAVIGMRLLFPIIVVVLTAKLSFSKVINLALHHPNEYSHHLHTAHPAIAAYGGMFILMVALDFFFEDREIKWLAPIERQLAKVGKLDQISVILSLIILLVLVWTVADHHKEQVMLAGIAGLATYLAVNSVGALFEEEEEEESEEEDAEEAAQAAGTGSGIPMLAGKAAFGSFLYLEVLDASFSFDNVTGAFAISDKIFVIMAGLGIGAMFIRSMTVYLVRAHTLETFVYLEHGAGYAIGTLAVILFVTIKYNVPDVITGLVGAAFITAAFISSLIYKRRKEAEEAAGSGGSGGPPVPAADSA